MPNLRWKPVISMETMAEYRGSIHLSLFKKKKNLQIPVHIVYCFHKNNLNIFSMNYSSQIVQSDYSTEQNVYNIFFVSYLMQIYRLIRQLIKPISSMPKVLNYNDHIRF